MPHLLRHGASVYNGHFRGPMTLTFIAERLAVDLSLSVFFRPRSVSAWIQTPNLPLAGPTHCAIAAVQLVLKDYIIWTFSESSSELRRFK